jgi:sugar phosphate isomerase/epimerase
MRLNDGRHFSYCLNVHPGERLVDMTRAIRDDVPILRTALAPDMPFGLGLRIARDAATELLDPKNFEAFKQLLHNQNLYAFTINGFPYGAFHNTRVKENVYLPDWSHPDRLQYTCDLADILSKLLPDDVNGSISTVPLGYRKPGMPQRETAADFETLPSAFSQHLLALADHLARLEAETGSYIHIGLEPEPDCILESTPQSIAFFQALFQSAGAKEALVRRHIGLCVDTCHVAMQFEYPTESLKTLHEAGIKISKIQLSAALECNASVSPDLLTPFDDGVYLHQVKSSNEQSIRDLSLWLVNPTPTDETLRIHAHVPLHWPGDEHLHTTRRTLTPEFWDTARKIDCDHLEVETYTFDVLPRDIRGNISVAEDMIHECKWALEQL